MDGRSFATKLMGSAVAASTATPTTPSSPSPSQALNNSSSSSRAERSEYLLEFTGLKQWPKHEGPTGACPASGCVRLNDCPNNTYRALRIRTPTNESWGAGLGSNLLYTEFTTASDWWYRDVFFRSLFDLDADPYQLQNVLPSVTAEAAAKLAARMTELWRCAGSSCP